MSLQPFVKRKSKKGRGKGFSKGELRQAGLSFRDALKRGIPIDMRRRSKHDQNVKVLIEYIKQGSEKAQ